MKRLILFLILIVGVSAQAEYLPDFSIGGKSTLQMTAGQTTRLSLAYTDSTTGNKVHHFMKMHDKEMHMLVVSRDLDKFSHIHPEFSHTSGSFELDINQTSIPDPDNKDVVNTIVDPGNYLVFTESMPHDQDMNMLYSRFEIEALPADVTKPNPPSRRPLNKNSVQYFTPDGQSAGPGAYFRIRFEYEFNQWCSWYLPKFYVLVETWNAEKSTYEIVSGLEEWLLMGGHAVLISRETNLQDVAFYHLHGLLPIAIPGEFVFPYHDHLNPMKDGSYRIFIQFKQQGKIRTIPFDFDYVNPPMPNPTQKLFSFLGQC